jgi:hypothetical protein
VICALRLMACPWGEKSSKKKPAEASLASFFGAEAA